tara:strand:- start:7 stop:177 length:171 start_codon:yes stop_codon:yes gene_type:complete
VKARGCRVQRSEACVDLIDGLRVLEGTLERVEGVEGIAQKAMGHAAAAPSPAFVFF